MKDKKYNYLLDGKQFGPVSFDELVNLELGDDALVWFEGLTWWKEIREIEELHHLIIAEKTKKLDSENKGLNNISVNFETFSNSEKPLFEADRLSIRSELYASIWERLIAGIIDILIVSIISEIFTVLLTGDDFSFDPYQTYNYYDNTKKDDFFSIFFLVFSWLYFTVSESSKSQATFGKQIFGIYVADINGNQINSWKATSRIIAKILLIIFPFFTGFIGFIIAIFTKRRQGLYDFISGTVVLKKKGK